MSLNEQDKDQYIRWVYEKEGNPLDKFLDSGFIHLDDVSIPQFLRNISLSNILRCTEGQIPKHAISIRPDLDIKYLLNSKSRIWDWSIVSANKSINFREIVSTYQKLPWDWSIVSTRSDLDFDFVIAHPELEWSWDNISVNPNVKLEHYKKYPKFPWNFYLMCSNSNFPIRDCLQFPSGSYKMLSKNSNLPLDFVRSNPEKNWDFSFLSERKDFGIEDIGRFILHKNTFNWSVISKNIPLKDILENKDYPWDNTQVSSRKLDIYIIVDNLSFPWDWKNLSRNLSISITDIITNNNLPWNWSEGVSSRKDILKTEVMRRVVVANPEIHWDWNYLSGFGDPDVVLDNINLGWDWRQFSVNPKLRIRHAIDPKNSKIPYSNTWWYVISITTPVKIIKKYTQYPWDVQGLILNPELTPKFIEEHPDMLWVNIWKVSLSPFLYEEMFFEQRFNRDLRCRKKQVRRIFEMRTDIYDDILGKIIDYIGYY